MIKKIKNFIFLSFFFLFLFFILKYYFSDKNIVTTNKSRTSYALINNKYHKDLPVLQNDTNNIIVYKDGLEEFKKKRKKRFWENLISGNNE